MRLTRLEAKGFKSFGDKIILHFGQGVTGVVGPNGCGKSNIVDAIRWVLGETKTRNLRSEKMENIIFNGAANRKPLQFAEVSLTFDNDRGILPTEYTTVTITRRYHRTGESEYLINGVHCRLKDIDNLFTDTGIGPDSYAIIELRMVDDILNDRDGSRRTLFEEAAGVSRFKQRRKETFRRLEDVSQDLERVEDLLHEIERNLKSLERQARQAERYFELKDKAKAAGLAAARRDMARRGEETAKLTEQMEALRKERDEIVRQAEAEEGGREALMLEVKAQEELFSGRQKTYGQMQEQIRKIESERKVSNERRRAEIQRKDQLSAQREQDRTRLLNLSTTLEDLTARQNMLTEQEAKAKELLSDVQEGLTALQEDFNLKSTAVDTAERELREIEENYRRLQRDEEVGRAQINTYRQERQRLEERSQQQTQSLVEFDGKMAEISVQLEESRLRLAQLQQREEERQAKEATLSARLEELRDETGALARRRDAAQNEYNLTKSLQDNLEGYPEAIRFLRKTRGWAAAEQVPLVSDLFATPEKYRVALEYYLEPVLNHYVVEDELEALRAVELLGAAGKGKASFFVLSRFAGLREEFPRFPEGSIPAMDVIECEPKHMGLVRWLLGQVCFMDRPVASQDEDVAVLAIEGNLVLKHRTVAGGSIGLYEGKRIGRVKNLEKLGAELVTLNKRLGELEAVQKTTREELAAVRAADARPQLEKERRESQRLEQDSVTWRVRREQAAQTLQDQSSRLESLTQTLAELETAATTRAPELTALTTRREELHLGQQALREARRLAEQALANRRDELNRGQLEAVRLQGQLTQTRNELNIRLEDRNRLEQRLKQTEEDLKKAEAALEELSQTDTIGDEDLKALYDELKDVDAGVKEAGQALYAARGRVETSDKLLRELARRRDQNQTLLGEIASRASGLEARLEAARERLLLEYNVDPADQPEEETLEPEELAQMSDNDLLKLAASLKEQLDKLGPINPVAMESYKEMKERHDFITGQKKDLTEARTGLEDTISEIETEARKAFLGTFNAVREHFHTVFRTLFTEEDTCDLVLQNTDNPLESPIDIIARPKGKRPLTINQLSGGEKTLTAIALLFSIYLIKPAPFCIFDEVDAPLDDNNIDKFNNIIREFSSGSQFIIVTHNKRTMTHADILYGVTMVEQGVSRVIPVDLR